MKSLLLHHLLHERPLPWKKCGKDLYRTHDGVTFYIERVQTVRGKHPLWRLSLPHEGAFADLPASSKNPLKDLEDLFSPEHHARVQALRLAIFQHLVKAQAPAGRYMFEAPGWLTLMSPTSYRVALEAQDLAELRYLQRHACLYFPPDDTGPASVESLELFFLDLPHSLHDRLQGLSGTCGTLPP